MSYGNRDKDQEKVKQLELLVSAAEAKLDEAVEFARANNLSFNWEGPAYGMGGSFDPEETKDEWGEDTNGWQASSQSC